jgi:type IX secretion system PorP/SprF family membrane protein
MLKNYTTLVFALVMAFSFPLNAQQEAQITQFMFNRLMYSPAYAGSTEGPCASGLYRKQWIGLEGSPDLQVISFHTPLFQRRVGLGINLSRQSIGITRQLTAEMSYAYRIPMGKGYLSAGLSASVRYFAEDYSDPRIKGTQDISFDPGVPQSLQSKYLPNFGVGLYYQAKDWYAGISLPRLVEGDIDFGAGADGASTEVRHYYAMGGYRVHLSPSVAFHPQVLFKYVDGTPFDADIYMGLELNEQFHGGLSYRLGGDRNPGAGESIDLVLGFKIQQRLMVSMGYDITLSKIRDYQNGTIEVMLGYCLAGPSPKAIDNPRFFE